MLNAHACESTSYTHESHRKLVHHDTTQTVLRCVPSLLPILDHLQERAGDYWMQLRHPDVLFDLLKEPVGDIMTTSYILTVVTVVQSTESTQPTNFERPQELKISNNHRGKLEDRASKI